MKSRYILLLASLLILLSACQPSPHWHGKDISGLMPNLKFQLTSDANQPLSQADFAGQSVLLFFGYTSCPDVCPATLSRLAQAYGALPDNQQKKLAILFVSVDPKRDTPAKLKQYSAFFSPGIIAATGTRQQLDDITSRYRTSYSYGPADASGNYVVNHGSGIYGFDRHGNIHLLIMGNKLSIKQLTDDMRQLIAQ